jgi:hypothetical protein
MPKRMIGHPEGGLLKIHTESCARAHLFDFFAFKQGDWSPPCASYLLNDGQLSCPVRDTCPSTVFDTALGWLNHLVAYHYFAVKAPGKRVLGITRHISAETFVSEEEVAAWVNVPDNHHLAFKGKVEDRVAAQKKAKKDRQSGAWVKTGRGRKAKGDKERVQSADHDDVEKGEDEDGAEEWEAPGSGEQVEEKEEEVGGSGLGFLELEAGPSKRPKRFK